MDGEARPRSVEEVMASMDEAHRRMREASFDLLGAIGELDRAGGWDEGDREVALSTWISARYRVAGATAREWVRVARALRGLPAVREAYGAGRLSWDQLRPLSRFATPQSDQRWSREAPVMRPHRLWTEARRHERDRRRGFADHAQRSVRTEWDPHRRFLHLEGRLAAEQGAAVEGALRRRAQEISLGPDPVADPGEARMADALVELVTASGGETAVPTVVVHADADVVLDRKGGLAETEDGTQLTDEAVRRLACDARVEWLLEREGRAVGIGRRGRQVPGSVLRALRYRDRGCRFPGCDRRQWVQAHHLTPWACGGRSDLDNLVLLCSSHHRLLHEGRWKVSGRADGELRFHDPGGRVLRSRSPTRRHAAA
jgi:hypothetical protein